MAKQYLDIPFCGGGEDGPDLSLKADVDDVGNIKGWGAVFNNIDNTRDIIEPGAFRNTLKQGGHNGLGVAMLAFHDTHNPVGIWNILEEKKKGLWVEGQLLIEASNARNAYVLAKGGAIRGMSIGYNSVVDEIDKAKKVRRIKEIDLWEISLVVFPANKKAKITNVKGLTDLIWELRDLIEECNTERQLETSLRDAGISKSDAGFMVSLIRPHLRDAVRERKRQTEREHFVNNLLGELGELRKKL